jgi:hypothetical protein
MEKENQPRLSRAHQNQAVSIASRGWKSSNTSSLSVKGQLFSLTFPFYRTGASAHICDTKVLNLTIVALNLMAVTQPVTENRSVNRHAQCFAEP